MRSDGTKIIQDPEKNYFRKAVQSLANPGIFGKSYWTLINALVNKAKIPIIPALLENELFVTDSTRESTDI